MTLTRDEALYLENLQQELRQLQRENVFLHRLCADLDARLTAAGQANADAELAQADPWLRSYVSSVRSGVTRTPPPRTERWESEQSGLTS